MYVDAAALTGTVLGVDSLVWVVAGGFTIGIAPLSFLRCLSCGSHRSPNGRLRWDRSFSKRPTGRRLS